MTDKDASRRWTVAIAQLRTRAARARRAAVPAEALEVIEQCLSLCEDVVRDLAGAGLESDTIRAKLVAEAALWGHLFEEMPAACVETDSIGVIVNANREAALMLNTSVKHLSTRLLLHFAEDRDQFGRLLRGLSCDGSQHRSSLVIRPRERAPLQVDAIILPRAPGEPAAWLWFFIPVDRHHAFPRRHGKGPPSAGTAEQPQPPATAADIFPS